MFPLLSDIYPQIIIVNIEWSRMRKKNVAIKMYASLFGKLEHVEGILS